jgi:hypothetical protein
MQATRLGIFTSRRLVSPRHFEGFVDDNNSSNADLAGNDQGGRKRVPFDRYNLYRHIVELILPDSTTSPLIPLVTRRNGSCRGVAASSA